MDQVNKRYLLAASGLVHRNYSRGIFLLDLNNPSANWVEVTNLPDPGKGIIEEIAHQIILHPINKSIVYALIGNKVYRSMSYGEQGTWSELFSVDDLAGSLSHGFPHAIKLSKLIFHPADPDIMYVSTYTTMDACQVPPLIFKTIDGGTNWNIFSASQNLPVVARIDISTAPYLPNANDPNLDPLYCMVSEEFDCINPLPGGTSYTYIFNDATGQFDQYTSTTPGNSYFTRHNFELSPSRYNTIGLTIHPDMYFSTLGFQRGTNGTFGAVYRNALNMHDDARDMEIIPDFSGNGNDHILIGNDGGVSLSKDNGITWENLNGPELNVTQFQGIDVAEANADIIVGGTQDNNAYKYDRPTNTWTRFADGDVYNFQISENNGQDLFYSNNPGGYYFNHTDLQNSFFKNPKLVPSHLTNAGTPVTLPQYQHPSGVIYFGQRELGILREPCYNAEFISDFYSDACVDDIINAIGVCEHNPDVVYVGFNGIAGTSTTCPDPKKLFKCENTSSDNRLWVDITGNMTSSLSGLFDFIEISGIAVHPQNPDLVWVSMGMISTTGNKRVIRSNDGGDTWTDYSDNLPGVPIMDIEYYKGSNNGLYAATDVGVFYTDDVIYPANGWICISSNLPVMVINDIEISYALQKVVLGTFGRGIYEADIPASQIVSYTPNTADPFNCTSDLVITGSNEIIANDLVVCENIIVKPGAKLTITGNVYMKPGKEIIVENSTSSGIKGGRLVLDGGHLTSAQSCSGGDFWKGVRVLGDPTASQVPLLTTRQAYFEIKNGGKISFAETAVALGSLQLFTITGQGGVIRTNNAVFENNKRDVVFWPYTNYLSTPSNPIGNLSRFVKTKFRQTLASATTISIPDTYPVTHVALLGVDGILFLENSFENNSFFSNPLTHEHLLNRGTGIYSINSGFRVTGFCDFYTNQNIAACPSENTFSKLAYGIKAISSNPLKTAFIDGNHFNSCYHGVFLNGLDYPYVVQNLFRIRGVPADITINGTVDGLPDIPYGLHINQCNNYRITENYFTSDPPLNVSNNNDIKVALQVSLPDGNPEEIYNNYFERYHSNEDIDPGVGVLVQGDPNDTDPNNLSGLQILCNDFKGAYINATERYTNHIALTVNGKVAPLQGANIDETTPAGNTFINIPGLFHDNCNVNSVAYPDAEYNTIDGLLPGNLNYFHHQNLSSVPLNVLCGTSNILNQITPFDYTIKEDACPTRINPNPQPDILRSAITHYSQLIIGELSLIDGGDTQALLDLIDFAPQGQVKEGLLGFSPYLSDDVLIEYIKSNPPHGMLKEVLLANSPLSKNVMGYVDALLLPDGVMNEIDEVQTGISERQHLEARVSTFNLQKQQNINDLVRYHLLRDTVPGYLDSLKSVFVQYNVDHSTCKLASAYASQKDYTQALAIIDAHLADHPDDVLCKLQKLMIEFDQQLSWCLNPTQQQRDKLDEIKDEPHKGCIAAKGFLELIEGLPLPDYRILPRSERLMFFSEEKKQNGKEEVVQIYPNPTTNWITIHINIQLEQTYFISVFDVTGKCVSQETTNKNTFDLNLSKFSRGLYSVHIRNENEIIHIGKIVKD